MIIWINGAFGSGKTQTAYELRRRLRGAYVYDPENAGCFIRDNLPAAVCVDDFQDYPMWRTFNLDMLRYIAEHYTGDIIVPMTLTNRAYFEEIAGALSREYDVRQGEDTPSRRQSYNVSREAVAMPYYLLLSRSITHAQRMSRVLERAGITARFFRPPMGLTDRGCSYAVRIGEGALPLALARLRAEGLLPMRVFYAERDGAFSEISM